MNHLMMLCSNHIDLNNNSTSQNVSYDGMMSI